jgi:hypothetical protein
MGVGYSVIYQPWAAGSVAGRETISTTIIADYSGPSSDVIMTWASELPYFNTTATSPTPTIMGNRGHLRERIAEYAKDSP